MSGQFFWAEKGRGAWLERNDDMGNRHHRLRVASAKDDSQLLCSSSDSELINSLQTLLGQDLDINIRFWGAQLADVAFLAAGKIDIYVCRWDRLLAPCCELLVVEAGGFFRKIDEDICLLSSSSLVI
jgi:fructose-1,6-bisphosphatase/inositol monophosphatase family enzyme